jgi:hypothetical protein
MQSSDVKKTFKAAATSSVLHPAPGSYQAIWASTIRKLNSTDTINLTPHAFTINTLVSERAEEI